MLFGLDIARIVHDATRGRLTPGVLLSKGAGRSTFEGVLGATDTLETSAFPAGAGESVLIIAQSTSIVPDVGMIVEISGRRLSISAVEVDPAGATYNCRVK